MPTLALKPVPSSADAQLQKLFPSYLSYRNTQPTVSSGLTTVAIETSVSGPNYRVIQFVARYNTTSLPANASINSVKFKAYVASYANTNGLRIKAEWYEGSDPTTINDWSTFPITDAYDVAAGTSVVPGGYNTWPITNGTLWNLRRGDGAYTNGTDLALGKTYTFSQVPNASYPDGGTDLTNGVNPPNNITDAGWVGWQTPNNDPTVTIDLGTSQVFNAVEVYACSQVSAGVYWPETVRIFGSDNPGGPWTELTFKAVVGTDPAAGTTGRAFTFRFPNTAAYQYCRVDFTQSQQWLFLGEIRVFNASQAASANHYARLRFHLEVPVAAPTGLNGPTIYTADFVGREPMLEISYGAATPNPPNSHFRQYMRAPRSRHSRMFAGAPL